jgi:aerobic carbon-monoxide dehydrogenase medium subunit
MIAQSFNYETPSTIEEAINLLVKHGEEAKVLSGGHSLIPMMKLRLASPETLIDINGVKGLSDIKEQEGKLIIGSLVRESQIEHSSEALKHFPIFGDVTKLIADPQVRNRGTIGGNLAHGDAANDHPAVMLALNATIVSEGPDGKKVTPIDEFFYGFYMTALQHGDILTEIHIPIPSGKTGNAYNKIERKVGDYAAAGVAVQITLDSDGVCTSAGIGLTNVNAVPLRASRSEQALIGKKLTTDVIAEAAKYASEDCNPSSDLRGSEDYKRHLVGVLVKRMINKSIERAS